MTTPVYCWWSWASFAYFYDSMNFFHTVCISVTWSHVRRAEKNKTKRKCFCCHHGCVTPIRLDIQFRIDAMQMENLIKYQHWNDSKCLQTPENTKKEDKKSENHFRIECVWTFKRINIEYWTMQNINILNAIQMKIESTFFFFVFIDKSAHAHDSWLFCVCACLINVAPTVPFRLVVLLDSFVSVENTGARRIAISVWRLPSIYITLFLEFFNSDLSHSSSRNGFSWLRQLVRCYCWYVHLLRPD